MTSIQLDKYQEQVKFKPSLKILQTKVGLTNSQLLSLTSNQTKFVQKLDRLNKAGVQSISYQKFPQALVYLHQAQKILQYAASCGKTIDRYLITTTLQNQACAYQRLWQLQRSSDYMEAIVYNLKTFINSLPPVQFNESLKDKKSISYLNLNTYVSRRLDGVFYYLQYSAVSSQVNKHQSAINSADQAQVLLKRICLDCSKYQQIVKGRNSSLMEDFRKSFDLTGNRLGTLLLQTREALNKIEINKNRKIFNFDAKVIEGFMIGQVMQIGTLTVQQAKQKNSLQQQISQIGIAYKVFYLSICYFVLGTQLRLYARQKFKTNTQETIDYKRSKIYHLYSIKLIATIVPYTSQYLRHIVKSFRKNYNLDLYSKDLDSNRQEISSIDIESFVNSQNLRNRLTEELTIRKLEDDHNETLKKKTTLQQTKHDTLFQDKQRQKFKIEKNVQDMLQKNRQKKKKKLQKIKSQGMIHVSQFQKRLKKKNNPRLMKQSLNIKKHNCIMGAEYCSCQKRRKSSKKLTKSTNQKHPKSCSSSKSKSKKKRQK